MIPYSYNMVDMGGIDLAEANGTVVPGVYEKIVEAVNLCGDLILYNWKFAEIDIAPAAYTVLQQAHSILINGLIQVTELDQITVIGLPPPIVPVAPLIVTENGLYEVEPPASGFNPVSVSVPPPVLQYAKFTENGIFYPPEGVDGFSYAEVEIVPEFSIEDYTFMTVRKESSMSVSGNNLDKSITFTWNGGGYIGCGITLFTVIPKEINEISFHLAIGTGYSNGTNTNFRVGLGLTTYTDTPYAGYLPDAGKFLALFATREVNSEDDYTLDCSNVNVDTLLAIGATGYNAVFSNIEFH